MRAASSSYVVLRRKRTTDERERERERYGIYKTDVWTSLQFVPSHFLVHSFSLKFIIR